MLKTNRIVSGMALAVLVTAVAAQAGIVTVVSTTGHNNKDNFGGNMADMTSGSGMNQPDPNDPSTWTATSNSFGDEWQSAALVAGGTNGKIGWTAFDFGSTVSGLESLYLWNIRENTAQGRRINQYNVYLATAPTVALPAAPTDNSAVDYDFSSGGWTQLGGTMSLAQRGATPDPANAVLDLGGASARYLAIEILSNFGDANRTGLAEIGVTWVPAPAALPAGLAMLGLVAMRRRRAS